MLTLAAVPAQGASLGVDGARVPPSVVRFASCARAAGAVMAAAQRGDALAQACLGFMYQYGRRVAQNYALAVYWYRRAAEQGSAPGQHLLGLMYDKGLGVPTNHVLAHTWLNLAAAGTSGTEHEDNVRLRDAVASKMSFGQLYDAQYLATTWVAKPER